MGFILNKMGKAKNGMNIIILDACRNNPFKRRFRSTSRGLAKMDAAKGSLIIYSTSPGNTSDDGKGRNGIFTKHLIQTIKTSKLEIGRLLRSEKKSCRRNK